MKDNKETETAIWLRYFDELNNFAVRVLGYYISKWAAHAYWLLLAYQLNPFGAPPLSVVKTMTELSNIPVSFSARVIFPTDSSSAATMAE